MNDGDGCLTLCILVAYLIGGILLGVSLGIVAQQRGGIALGTVTATAGILTVTGEATMIDDENGPMLVVIERQGDTVLSTSYLRDWTLIERTVGE